MRVTLRPRRILAVARRDLSMELKHRRGWVLPVVMAGLLLPTSAIPTPMDDAQALVRNWRATGQVPEAIAALPGQSEGRGRRVHFVEEPNQLRVVTDRIPDEVRETLDAGAPEVTLVSVPVGMVFPGRSMLLALIATSSLTGAVSASVGGERSNKTLVALLTSGLTKLEVITGKWVAWGGFGALCALLAATAALALGRLELGWWLLPLPWVPLATVALGLWLVRQAGDVVAGSAVSLRVLPALLAATGIIAWFAGRLDPHLGALVPLGGALIASGDTWADTPTAVILSAVVSLLFSATWLATTAQDLDEQPRSEGPVAPNRVAVLAALIGAACWWTPIGTALLWGEAGNPVLAAELPLEAGIWAGLLALGCLALVRVGQAGRPAEQVGAIRPDPAALGLAVVVGIALGLLGTTTFVLPLGIDALPAFAERLALAASPGVTSLAALLATAVVDEVLFRGWLQRAAGPGRAVLVWTVVKFPLDPLHGLLTGTGLAWISRRGGVGAAIAARCVALAVSAALGGSLL